MTQTCPYCREAIAGFDSTLCPTCGTPHHSDCYSENGGCTVFGCDQAPGDETKITLGARDLAGPSSAGISYLVGRGTQQFGPYSEQELRTYIAQGRISRTDMAWSQGMPQWVPISQLPGLSSNFSPAQLPPQRHEAFSGARTTPPPKPDNHLVGAILCTLFCCVPFGIVAIIHASQVDSHYSRGDYAGAQDAARKASNWTNAAMLSWLALVALYILVMIVAASGR